MTRNASRANEPFVGYYWDELRQLVTPAGPLTVCAVYTFAMLFVRYHYARFRTGLFGAQAGLAEFVAVEGLWFMFLPTLTILALQIAARCLPKTRGVFTRRRFRDFGFRPGSAVGWRDAAILFLVMLPFVLFAVSRKDFASTYPLYPLARTSLIVFLIWQAAHLVYMFGWELLNRGFLLFGLEEKMGRFAILATAIPFALLHIGKPELEAYGSFFAAIALGWVALRARSFIPGAALHWIVSATLDALAIVRAGGFK
ncbi:MAG: CPBP family intramembrane metalloprotease [Vicinamibacteria bacterium]|nr:CPBP family intramembrane metalloprotease [Vicinamibacteria bacterium]